MTGVCSGIVYKDLFVYSQSDIWTMLGVMKCIEKRALTKFPKRRDAALVMLGVCTGNGGIARGAPFSRAFVQTQYCTV